MLPVMVAGTAVPRPGVTATNTDCDIRASWFIGVSRLCTLTKMSFLTLFWPPLPGELQNRQCLTCGHDIIVWWRHAPQRPLVSRPPAISHCSNCSQFSNSPLSRARPPSEF